MDNGEMKKPEGMPMPKVDSTLKEENVSTQRMKPLYRSTQIVWYILGIMEILLLLRFFLKLFAANPEAGFTQFIYGATYLFAGPFLFVFNISQAGGSIFEWSTLLAMAVYFLLAWMIVKALVMGKPVTTKEATKKLPEQEKL
jgi:hypothetical protein